MAINTILDPVGAKIDDLHSLRGRDILCFSHDWTGDPLSKTHLMRLLSRHNRVLWVNSIGYRTPSVASKADMSRAVKKLLSMAVPIREPEPNIFVLNPVAVPFYGKVGKAVNLQLLRFQIRRAMKKLGFKNAINWVFNPAAGMLARQLGDSFVIYYCVDEYTAFAGVSSRALAETERCLLKSADLVIVSAQRLRASENQRAENPRDLFSSVMESTSRHFRRASR